MKRIFLGLGVVLVASLLRAEPLDYNRDIQPLLAEHCLHCHGRDDGSRKAGLRLDDRAAALKGGESDGPAIVPGQPDQSSLLARVRSTDPDVVMPPPQERKPLRPADIEKLRQWIQQGAPYAGHWAFTAPVQAAVPTVPSPDGSPSRHPVDAFVRARLQTAGLTPSPSAAPEILCRRLHLDLIGLPPSLEAVSSFRRAVAEKGLEAAVAQLVDALLQDRRYGEKWARHWLDVARYSDSNGFEKDLPREQWIWRDWVIQALNSDLPYDQFIIEQIAGDLLGDRAARSFVATGYLRNSMINEEGAIVPEEWRMEAMFDRMDAIGSGILGLSLKCGQCHSHKFDPLTQAEYYGLFAFLNNTYEAQSWVYSEEQQAALAKLRAGITAVEERLKKQLPDWEQKLAAWEGAERNRWSGLRWQVVEPQDTHSSSELNHPTILPDHSVLTLGHRTIAGDVHFLAEPRVEQVTGIRLEILPHGDLPFGGPGRSYLGTWALTELVVEAKKPGSDTWEKLPLVNVTADFAEPPAGMEPEWENKSRDKDRQRLRGPAAYLADGDDKTAWRADRGRGRRNTASVAVAQFAAPLTLPPGTRLKFALVTNHGGDDNGPKNTQVGRFRISLTQAPDPRAPNTPYAALLALETPAEQRTAAEKQALFDAWRQTVPEFKALNDEIDKLWRDYPEALTTVLHLSERWSADARETRRLERGVWNQGREVIPPGVPAALHPWPADQPLNRLGLARWLVDRRSPLTARVAVNRCWQAVFGVGIVETAEDFGTRAPEPSHPQLLDWLAVDFMDHGWSQKHLLRRLLTSETYRQTSRVTPEQLERDPRNRLLARGPRFRVEAEVVRDIALTASGLLTDKLGGPSIFPPVPQSVLDFNFFKPAYWKPAEDASRYSRALYVFRKRSMPDPVLSALDAPTGDTACTRRARSNSPLAALTTLNEPLFIEAAQALALRVLRDGGPDDAARIAFAFQLCTSRQPSEAERARLVELLESRRARLRRGELRAAELAFSPFTRPTAIPPDATPNEVAAWAIVARVLLNLDETIAKN
ncbi:MAG: PSD1 and planctomycete cytochrome C domain-containing protein [Pirellulales bacterium]